MNPVRREGVARSGSAIAHAAVAHAVQPEPVAPVAPPAKHLRVAPKVSRRVLRRRRRARYAIFGLAMISAASMFLLVTFHVFAVQSSFQLDKLRTAQATAQRQNEFLRNQVASLSSATTISKAAAAIGMVRPLNVVLLKTAPLPAGASAGPGPSATPVSLPATPYNYVAAGP